MMRDKDRESYQKLPLPLLQFRWNLMMAIYSRGRYSDNFVIFFKSQSRGWWSCGRYRFLKIHGDQGSKCELFPAVANCSRKDTVIPIVLFTPKLPYKEISMGPGGMSYCTWACFPPEKLEVYVCFLGGMSTVLQLLLPELTENVMLKNTVHFLWAWLEVTPASHLLNE